MVYSCIRCDCTADELELGDEPEWRTRQCEHYRRFPRSCSTKYTTARFRYVLRRRLNADLRDENLVVLPS